MVADSAMEVETMTPVLAYPPSYRDQVRPESDQWAEAVAKGLEDAASADNFTDGWSWTRQLNKIFDLKLSKTLSPELRKRVCGALLSMIQSSSDKLTLFFRAKFCHALARILKKDVHVPDFVVPWKLITDLFDKWHFPKARPQQFIGSSPMTTHSSALVFLARKARPYYGPEAEQELYEYLRPYFCPHDVVQHKGHALLCTMMPTEAVAEGAEGTPFWLEEVVAMMSWADSEQSQTLFFSLLARLARMRVGRVDMTPYLDELFTMMLGAFSLPLGGGGMRKSSGSTPSECNIFRQGGGGRRMAVIAKLIVYLYDGPDGAVHSRLVQLMRVLETFFHPSNGGYWTGTLGAFVLSLSGYTARRIGHEKRGDLPQKTALGRDSIEALYNVLFSALDMGLYSKNKMMSLACAKAFRNFSFTLPTVVLPPLMQRVFEGLGAVTETHQTQSAFDVLCATIEPLLCGEMRDEAAEHIPQLLSLALPGIDANDPSKTTSALSFFYGLFTCVPLVADSGGHPAAAGLCAVIEDWGVEFLDRVFRVLADADEPGKHARSSSSSMVTNTVDMFFGQLGGGLQRRMMERVFRYVVSHQHSNSIKDFGMICMSSVSGCEEEALALYIPHCHAAIVESGSGRAHGDGSTEPRAAYASEAELLWLLRLCSHSIKRAGTAVLPHLAMIRDILDVTLLHEKKTVYKAAGKLLRNVLKTMTLIYPLEARSLNAENFERDPHAHWGERIRIEQVALEWHEPSEAEVVAAEKIIAAYIDKAASELGAENTTRERVWRALYVLRNVVRGAAFVLSAPEGESVDVATWRGQPPAWATSANEAGEAPDAVGASGTSAASAALGVPLDLVCDGNGGGRAAESQYTAVLSAGRPATPASLRTARKRIIDLTHSALATATAAREDDVKTCVLCTKVLALALHNYGAARTRVASRASAQRGLVLWHKEHSRDRKASMRSTLVSALIVRHMQRVAEGSRALPFSETYAQAANDLFALALHPYSRVRKKAQSALSSCTKTFRGFARPLALSALGALTMPGAPEHTLNGALYTLGLPSVHRCAQRSWGVFAECVLAVCRSAQIEKLTIQARVASLFATLCNHYEPLPVRGTADNEARAALEERLVAFAGTGDEQHWRYQVVAAASLALLITPNSALAAPSLRWLVASLVSDVEILRDVALHAVMAALCNAKPVRVRKQIDVPAEQRSKPQTVPEDFTLNIDTRDADAWSAIDLADKNFAWWNARPARVWTYDKGSGCVPPAKQHEAVAAELRALIFEDKTFVAKLVDALVLDHRSDDGVDGSGAGVDVGAAAASLVGVGDAQGGRGGGGAGEMAGLATAIRAVVCVPGGSDAITSKTWASGLFDEVTAQFFKSLFHNYPSEARAAFLPFVKSLGTRQHGDSAAEKYCVASEIIAGALRGSKHWPHAEQCALWDDMLELLGAAIREMPLESIDELDTALNFVVADRDPRRSLWARDLLLAGLFADPSTVTITKRIRLAKPVIAQFSWRGAELANGILQQASEVLAHPYKAVREELSTMVSYVMSNARSPPRNAKTNFIQPGVGTADAPMVEFYDRMLARLEELGAQVPADDGGGAAGAATATASAADDAGGDSTATDAPAELRRLRDTFLRITVSLLYTHSPVLAPHAARVLAQIFAVQTDRDPSKDVQTLGKRSTTWAAHAGCFTAKENLAGTLEVLRASLASENWRVRGQVLLFLEELALATLFVAAPEQRAQLTDMALDRLRDPQPEVRLAAQRALSSLVQLAARDETGTARIRQLADDAMKLARTKLPKRKAGEPEPASLAKKIRVRHAGVLALGAVMRAFPYDVPSFMPPLVVQMAGHQNDPAPIKETVQRAMAEFWRTHRDMWHIHRDAFDPDDLALLTDLFVSPSYYA